MDSAASARTGKIDIGLLALNYPPEPTGISTYTGSLSVGLANDGYGVTAHVAHPHYPQWRRYPGYSQWTRTERFGNVVVRRRLHFVPSPPRGLRRFVSEVSFGLRTAVADLGTPQVVIALSPPLFATALAVARLRLKRRRPRLIIWVQDLYSVGLLETGEGGGVVQALTKRIERSTLRAADRVVTIHQRFADLLVDEMGVPRRKVAVVRNWTHLSPCHADAHDPQSARGALRWPRGVTLVVHTGNMGAKQGLGNVVEAARIADQRGLPVHFIMVGEGGERRRLEESARGIGRITFVDPLSDSEYRLALSAADIVLVNEKPGVSAMALPSKLTSYFDAGRPVIGATDPAGLTASEIRTADAGLVVPAGDAESLLRAILFLRENPAAADRYGANGLRYRAAFLDEAAAIELWKQHITEVMEDLLSRSASLEGGWAHSSSSE